MDDKIRILCVIGPTASGKSSRAVAEATKRNGEVISVDSRQVYRMLDIGTEKMTLAERQGVPHHLINIRNPREGYSAGDFVADASRLIRDITARGKFPVLAGGTHFYFDALVNGLLSEAPALPELRAKLEKLPVEELAARVARDDPRRASELDTRNRRRLIRALEIIETKGAVPSRLPPVETYDVEWIVLNPPSDELRTRIETRLTSAFERGLVEEVQKIRDYVGDKRLNEFGLEYRIVGEFLRKERDEESLMPTLTARIAQYARRQRAWLRKLEATYGPYKEK